MYKVEGFLFENEAMAELAKKEEEGIRFIKARTALDNPEVVLKLYKNLLEQEVFSTPVGIRFLTELQNILYTSTYIAASDIPPIKVPAVQESETETKMDKEIVTTVKEHNSASKSVKKTENTTKDDYKKPFYVTLFFAIVFAISILAMFLISEISGNNVNIINYREKIQDEYSIWEVELETKENRLEEWEAELEEREAALRNVDDSSND